MPETFGTGRPEKMVFITFAGNLRHGATGKEGLHYVCRKSSARGDRKRRSPPTTGTSTSARGDRKNGRPDDGDINIGMRRPEKWSPRRRGHQHRYAAIGKRVAPTTRTSTSARGDRKNGRPDDGDINIGTRRPEKMVAPYDGDINIGTRQSEKWSPRRRGHQHLYGATGKMVFITFAGNLRHGATGKEGRPDDADINIGTRRSEKWSPPTTRTSTSVRGDRKNDRPYGNNIG